MLSTVKIKNFKSIRDLEFSPKRVNVFIGEPNTGKTNIIEALGFFSPSTFRDTQTNHEVLRFKSTADLFFDQRIKDRVSIRAENWVAELMFSGLGYYQGNLSWSPNPPDTVPKMEIVMDHAGLTRASAWPAIPIYHYIFRPLQVFPNGQPGFLSPPFGDNLVAVLYTNETLRQRVSDLLRPKGFRLQLKPTDNELLITKDVNDVLYSYPWISVSETLRRAVFLMAVLETNRDATLLLDEPESNTFPFYTKYFAERIALDETNQFFVTTHNPYLLSSLVEKTPSKDLNVFVATMEKFETRLKRVPEQKLGELLELDSDAFFNLDRLVEG